MSTTTVALTSTAPSTKTSKPTIWDSLVRRAIDTGIERRRVEDVLDLFAMLRRLVVRHEPDHDVDDPDQDHPARHRDPIAPVLARKRRGAILGHEKTSTTTSRSIHCGSPSR